MPREGGEAARGREGERDRDLVLDPMQYAYILDETKGQISVHVGPTKASFSNTDRPVKFSREKGFEECMLEEATRRFPTADEGYYLVLENPSATESEPNPKPGSNSPVRLNTGRKVNIPGPVSFPLWPGQVARVIQGHNLRSNQYLIVRVYNEEQARANWAKGVVKPQKPQKPQADKATDQQPAEATNDQQPASPPAITMGQLLVIKGTDVSFYIPPTGVEVLPDESTNYVRSAVTLERLEYCILLDENGTKRFVRGPAVVFPAPTETFVKSNELRKFKVIDLSPLSGLYVKVISAYKDGDRQYKEGEELFVTGKDQTFYFPRPEHAIIKYGEQDVHHAVAIPAGEARYVLDRENGKISLVRGPAMFLPDPRKEVIVKRILDERTVALMYPGNQKALEYNRGLVQQQSPQGPTGMSGASGASGAVPRMFAAGLADANVSRMYSNAWENEAASKDLAADDIQRRSRHTPPRIISLDTKYDGAVAVNVWTGYAIMVVGKDGGRKVVQGPQTVILEYDEILEGMELSTGTPKGDGSIRTVYLRVRNNKVSDMIQAVTRDLVRVGVQVSYRVNFEGEPSDWFNVENYVKFLVEHLRSLVRNVVKGVGIEKFNNDAVQVIRDAILGLPDQQGKRPGRKFEENGMKVYDVEILDITVGDQTISGMLVGSQHNAVKQAITIAQKETELATTKRSEIIQQEIDVAKAETTAKAIAIREDIEERESKYRLAMQGAKAALQELIIEAQLKDQSAMDKAREHEVSREAMSSKQRLYAMQGEARLKAESIMNEADSIVKKAGAITPQIVAALQAFGDKKFLGDLASAFGPHALLRGNSISDVLAQLLAGTPQLGQKVAEMARIEPPVMTTQATRAQPVSQQ
jgi:major vault protein